jgi:sRNA-binding carbon storage regulator CsrA
MSLFLTLKPGQRIGIGDGIVVQLRRIKGGRATLAITAPEEQQILRESLLAKAEAAESACTSAENSVEFSAAEGTLPT